LEQHLQVWSQHEASGQSHNCGKRRTVYTGALENLTCLAGRTKAVTFDLCQRR
jgi:hypothetical protein